MSCRWKTWVFAVLAAFFLVWATTWKANIQAAEQQSHAGRSSLWNRDTLTDNWFGAGEHLAEYGIAANFGLTHIYQYNAADGLEDDIGRHSGSYDLEIEADLQTLAGLDATFMYLHGEGSWAGGDGLDARAVGSLFGINDDFAPDRTFDLTELWLQRAFWEHKVKLRIGKLDLTGGFECRGCPVTFDSNLWANDETTQFLNGALVNNPSIAFPDNGLAAVLFINPVPWWYVSAGIADAEADVRETGFNTAFSGNDFYFSIFETGIVPMLESSRGRLRGAYRLGIWHENTDRERLDGQGEEPNNMGAYLSLDQMLLKEARYGAQGLGAFFRAGWAEDEVNEIESFISAGMQYEGLLPGRDNDRLGLGFAWGGLSEEADFSADFERAVEIYYNAEVTPWLRITPDLQVVSNPGGSEDSGDAVVAGIRLQLSI